jgi:hypothetical protein
VAAVAAEAVEEEAAEEEEEEAVVVVVVVVVVVFEAEDEPFGVAAGSSWEASPGSGASCVFVT